MDKLPTLAELALQTKDELDQRVIKIASYMSEVERMAQTTPSQRVFLRRSSGEVEMLAMTEMDRLRALQELLKDERRLARILIWELMTAIGLNEESVVLERYWREKQQRDSEVRS